MYKVCVMFAEPQASFGKHFKTERSNMQRFNADCCLLWKFLMTQTAIEQIWNVCLFSDGVCEFIKCSSCGHCCEL